MIRTSLALRKALSQKENRHRVHERHFGSKDASVPLEGRDLGNTHEDIARPRSRKGQPRNEVSENGSGWAKAAAPPEIKKKRSFRN